MQTLQPENGWLQHTHPPARDVADLLTKPGAAAGYFSLLALAHLHSVVKVCSFFIHFSNGTDVISLNLDSINVPLCAECSYNHVFFMILPKKLLPNIDL